MIDETGRKLQDKYRTDSLLPNRTTWTQIGHVRVVGKQDSRYLIARKSGEKIRCRISYSKELRRGRSPVNFWGGGTARAVDNNL